MNQANNITIEVHTHYLKEHSEVPEKYTFAYKITISNKGQQGAKLINRYWLITDGNGKKTEVEGQGVVGEQPHIPVGESFQYTSGAMLDTPVGTMQGFYEMQSDSGESFKAPIKVFRLAVPNSLN